MDNITTVKDFAEMVAIFPKEEGKYYYVVDEKRYYTYCNEEYIPVKAQTNTNIEMSLYDMNSQIMAQLPSIDLQEKEEVTKELLANTNNLFYLMYGKEISYFTLFHFDEIYSQFSSMHEAMMTCLQNVGEVKSYDLVEGKDAIEIWVTTPEEVTTCLYFFPYDAGVVLVGV